MTLSPRARPSGPSGRFLLTFMLLSAALFAYGWYSGWLQVGVYQWLLAGESRTPPWQAGAPNEERSTGRRLALEDYRVGIDALALAGVGSDLSGLTYHPTRHTLFSVVNRPPQIVELSLDGVPLRTIPVEGAFDLEGITHVRGNEFFLADERSQQLIHVVVGEGRSPIDVRGRPRIGLTFDRPGNLGLEGLSWDHVRHRLFVVREKRPLRLFELSGVSTLLDGGPLDLQIGEWLPRGSAAFLLRDLSSLSYHEESGNMLLLSDESRLVIELDSARRPSGLLVLRKGWHGLKNDVPQPEGLTVGPGGEIFVVSEPNLFYRFDPPRQ